jgi:hypothetical protein
MATSLPAPEAPGLVTYKDFDRPRQVVGRSPMVEFIAQVLGDDGTDEEGCDGQCRISPMIIMVILATVTTILPIIANRRRYFQNRKGRFIDTPFHLNWWCIQRVLFDRSAQPHGQQVARDNAQVMHIRAS